MILEGIEYCSAFFKHTVKKPTNSVVVKSFWKCSIKNLKFSSFSLILYWLILPLSYSTLYLTVKNQFPTLFAWWQPYMMNLTVSFSTLMES